MFLFKTTNNYTFGAYLSHGIGTGSLNAYACLFQFEPKIKICHKKSDIHLHNGVTDSNGSFSIGEDVHDRNSGLRITDHATKGTYAPSPVFENADIAPAEFDLEAFDILVLTANN